MEGQGAGHTDPLPLASGELVRVAAHVFPLEPHHLKEFKNPGLSLAAVFHPMHIERFTDEIYKVRTEMMDDARIAVISYGTVARAAHQAIKMARERRVHVGAIQPLTIWPFPDPIIADALKNVKKIIVAELNMGQMVNEIKRIAPRNAEVFFLGRYDGEVMTPQQILDKIREVK